MALNSVNEALEAIVNKAKEIGIFESSSLSPSQRSNLYNMIEMACDPSHHEPDMALNLEICDLINQKQTFTPREAVKTLLLFIHSRDTHQSLLALSLLDVCVKNCGFPFHMQIATKDFLNELVKRFPDKPPAVKSPVLERILGLIQLWNFSIYENTKYKQDLIHLNDMYRLLSFKGYRFPPLKAEESVITIKEDVALKTKDELESEDRMVQEARLQELLRQGTPEALNQANELMKTLSGYYHDKKPNYEVKEKQELDKIKEKVDLLHDMLLQIPPGENVIDNAVLQDILAIIKTSKPKITTWIQDNADDSKLDQLLFLNDKMNDTLEKYESLKAADVKSSLKKTSPILEKALLKAPSNNMVIPVPNIKPSPSSNASFFDSVDSKHNPTQSSKPVPSLTKTVSSNSTALDDLLGISFEGPPQFQAEPSFQPIQLPVQPLVPLSSDSNNNVTRQKLKQDILGLYQLQSIPAGQPVQPKIAPVPSTTESSKQNNGNKSPNQKPLINLLE